MLRQLTGQEIPPRLWDTPGWFSGDQSRRGHKKDGRKIRPPVLYDENLISQPSERGRLQTWLSPEKPTALTSEELLSFAGSHRVQSSHLQNILRGHLRRIEERGAEPLHEMRPRAPSELAYPR
jgi:hypothetical protein